MGVKTRPTTLGGIMPEYKNITIRIPKDGSLFQEINRRRLEGNGSWAPAAQSLLSEGWHTLLLQRVSSRINGPQTSTQTSGLVLCDPHYVNQLETMLASFLTKETHPRYKEDQGE